jgi:hypothetical protein
MHLRIEYELRDLAVRFVSLFEYGVERIFYRLTVFLFDALFESHILVLSPALGGRFCKLNGRLETGLKNG